MNLTPSYIFSVVNAATHTKLKQTAGQTLQIIVKGSIRIERKGLAFGRENPGVGGVGRENPAVGKFLVGTLMTCPTTEKFGDLGVQCLSRHPAFVLE